MNVHLSQILDQWQAQTILVLGDAMLDCYLDGGSHRLSQEAPVPIVNITHCEDLPGGAANTAANVASLGGQVILLSVIGEDPEGRRLQTALDQRGVVTGCLITDADRKTLLKQRLLGNTHLLARMDQGSVDAIAPAIEQALIDQLKALFPKCDAVIVSDYHYGIMTPRVIEALIHLQSQYPRVLVVDSKRLEAYQTAGVTAVKPNYQEAIRLLNLTPVLEGRIQQIWNSGDRLLHLTGAERVTVTLDVDGAVVFEQNHPPLHLPTRPAPFSHTAGAGDTFVAALALSLATGATTEIAATLATRAAAIVVNQSKTTTCVFEDLCQSVIELTKFISHPFDLSVHLQRYRRAGQRIVFTNGCFDILHAGHVTHLTQAKALGDVLIVGVNTDESIQQLKGRERPVNPLNDRLIVLAALTCVDHVVPFAELSPRNLIQTVRPDLYIKGGDYTRETLPEAELVEALGGTVKILPHLGDRSTSRLIQQIRSAQSCLI